MYSGTHARPRIAIPEPTSLDAEFNARNWLACADAVEGASGEPVRVQLQSSAAEILRTANTCQGVLLPGSCADVNPHKYGEVPVPETGRADPARENADELLLQDAHNLYKPLLCICYGTQALNVWRTGTLMQHLATPVQHSAGPGVIEAHTVEVYRDTLLAAILQRAEDVGHSQGQLRLPTNSIHHQAIGQVGDGLRVAARCVEDDVIEAVEGILPEHFVLGLQWHPEQTQKTSSASRAIFAYFLQMARSWRPRAVRESVGQ